MSYFSSILKYLTQQYFMVKIFEGNFVFQYTLPFGLIIILLNIEKIKQKLLPLGRLQLVW